MVERPDYEASLAHIRLRFVRKLQGWLPDFAELQKNLSSEDTAPGDLIELRMRAHKLAGSAKTFGFNELTPHAVTIEEELDKLIAHQLVVEVFQRLHPALESLLLQAQSIIDQNITAEPAPSNQAKPFTTDFPALAKQPQYRILIADDDDLVRSLLSETLTPEGCEVLQTENGADALMLMQHLREQETGNTLDMIVLDLNMPTMGGFEVLKTLKANPAWWDIPVLLLSRRDEDETIVEGLVHGAVDYITKPFNVPQLAERVLSTVKSRAIKVLITDDDELICTLLRQRFDRIGYTVLEAHTGAEALQSLKRDKPDIVILDVMMPGGMDGMTVLRHMRNDAETTHIPVLMLSAKRQQENILKGLENGANDYLTKPFDVEELAARVSGILQRRPAS